jgi:hypothetical protein
MAEFIRHLFRKNKVKLGGQWVDVQPLSLENALGLALLLAPHVARIEHHWPEIKRAMDSDGDRPKILTVTFRSLRDELSEMPGDMVKAMGLLLDRDPVDVAGAITAQEFVEALPVLDRVNDLGQLWASAQALGLTARYNGKQRTD